MKEIVNEILSDFDDAPKANTDIAGSIFILNETKAKIESNFLFRYFKAGLLIMFEILFVILSIIVLYNGYFLFIEVNSFLNPLEQTYEASKGIIESNKEVKEVAIKGIKMIQLIKISIVILILILAFISYLISRFFRRSRKRIFLLKSICDNIDQVIVNLKEFSGKK